jgi:hypothetical protein
MQAIEEALAALSDFTAQVAAARQEIVARLERGEAPELAGAVDGLGHIVDVTRRQIRRIEEALSSGSHEAMSMSLLGVPGDAKMWDYSGGGFDYESHEGVRSAYERANRAVFTAYQGLKVASAD